jgi:hypothetical protein
MRATMARRCVARQGSSSSMTVRELAGESQAPLSEVHVTKSDGSEVEVLLDSSFNVVKTQASPQGQHH